ncbi:MAG: ATP-dependent RNA helicase DeaD [Candidatus Krumholzibacteriia bacterium]|jgi:ATP-dependent RNA helicase DeaD
MSENIPAFSELNLVEPLVKAVTELGYETPLPIQAACIPPLLEGRDVLGLAQTGTGKTAAFALPLMSRIDMSVRKPQVLVLAPTRELAIQVAEAFQAYARHLKGFHVLPIYGGQRYSFQFSQLNRGPQVIVGTPGRIQDHMRRGTLDLSELSCLVLDEADEMLRMGFVDDVEAIMAHTPETRQVALFSATMPPQIRRITKKYLKDPVEIRIDTKTVTAENIEQVYLVVPNAAKFEALVRVLETESYDGIIIFSRTRVGTTELAEKLAARGYSVAALNGDMDQRVRERTIKRLKSGNIDILVATDVAARGLDVERISHVINYDIPGDTEAYIHRIGRTGRVGRYGKAILFANPREQRLLRSIERVTRKPLTRMEMPSHDTVTRKRIEKFSEELTGLMEKGSLEVYQKLNLELMEKMGVDIMELAAGLLMKAQKDSPLRATDNRALNSPRFDEPRPQRRERGARPNGPEPSRRMALYRMEVGSTNGVEVRNIVGAIANETGLRSRYIGQIRIHPNYSTVELPDDVPHGMLDHLRKTIVGGKMMNLSPVRQGGGYQGGGNQGGGHQASSHQSSGQHSSGQPSGGDRPQSPTPTPTPTPPQSPAEPSPIAREPKKWKAKKSAGLTLDDVRKDFANEASDEKAKPKKPKVKKPKPKKPKAKKPKKD